MNFVETLARLSLHDRVIRGLSYDPSTSSVSLSVEVPDERDQDSVVAQPTVLQFTSVIRVSASTLSGESLAHDEILDVQTAEAGNALYTVTFALAPVKPGGEIALLEITAGGLEILTG